ncbi:MAG TPA: hypothetical protein VGI24_04815 [Solirubrobacteraceae bacterium]|jgi:Fic family protein
MHVESIREDEAIGDSMLEEIRRTATQRLRQIEPLIEEAHRLRDVLEAIERGPLAEGTQPRYEGLKLAGSAGARRAAKGANKRVILDLVGQRPGITVAEISASTGVKRTVAASTVSRLKRTGELREHKQGGLCLARELQPTR